MLTKTVRICALALFALPLIVAPVAAQDNRVWHHGSSLIGEPKYPADFTHFDYVNPDAPKGGTVRLGALGGFDTFNPILPQGETASGLGLVYERLMTPAADEISTGYGLLAEAYTFPEDLSSVTYRLRENARWHDGEPVTVEDVVWSFEKLVEISPSQANYYADVVGAAVTGEREVTFTFGTMGNAELPKIVGEIPVLPQHWWEGKNADGEPRDVSRSTLELPMGSGPYTIDSFVPGRTVSYVRVPDYWGAEEPVNVGQNNFDTINYEYFRDITVEFEAFKGDQFDWWSENAARRWATGYDFPAVKDGRIIKERFDNEFRSRGLMIGFIANTRRPQLKDPLVREAINYALDFEELQRDVFFGEYERIGSYFSGTDLASTGLPAGEELEILQSIRDLVPASIFTEENINPVGGDPAKLRDNLRTALSLFNEAGYTLQDGKLVDVAGQQLSFEILLNGPTIEIVALPLQANLAKIGVDVSVRSVDSPQYINRIRSRDYDFVYTGWAQSLSPGNEQRDYWGSEAANQENSRNYAGIDDPGIDALIEKIIFADDRDTLIAATKALDRVLLANHFVVPSYTATNSRIARWDRFSHPETLPKYSIGFPTVWWFDAKKAAAIE